MARNQGKTVEAWLRAQALAAGLTPRRLETEYDSLTESWRVYGFDREGNRKILAIPRYAYEDSGDPTRMERETGYYLQLAQRKMQKDMEQEMANVYYNNWTSTGTSTNTTTSDTFLWNQYGGLGQRQQTQAEMDRLMAMQQQTFITKSAGIAPSGKRKPKDFREELQQELDSFLKDALN